MNLQNPYHTGRFAPYVPLVVHCVANLRRSIRVYQILGFHYLKGSTQCRALANGRRLIRSVSGSKIGAEETRCSSWGSLTPSASAREIEPNKSRCSDIVGGKMEAWLGELITVADNHTALKVNDTCWVIIDILSYMKCLITYPYCQRIASTCLSVHSS